jgi:hypothetical protein
VEGNGMEWNGMKKKSGIEWNRVGWERIRVSEVG